jgi:thioesterase domain-containing protein
MLLVGQSDISVDIAQCQIQPPQLWTFHYKHTRCMVVNLREFDKYCLQNVDWAAELFGLSGLSASMAMQLANWINQMYSLSIHSMHHNL